MLYLGRGRLWILVADRSRARVVAPDAIEGQFRTIGWLGVAEHPHYPPPSRLAAHADGPSQFSADIARRLNEWAEQDRFDDLIVVAPEPVASEIRGALRTEAVARLAGTQEEDCATLDDQALSLRLAPWWLPLPGQVGADWASAPDLLGV